VGLDDRLRDIQPETGARDLALEHRGCPEEPLEETSTIVLADPDARVGDLDADASVPRSERDVDGAAGGRELDCVRDEVVQQLRQASTLPVHGGHVLGVNVERNAREPGVRPRRNDGLLDEHPEVDRLEPELQATALEPRGE